MKTNILTLGGTVEGDNVFPIYTTLGVYERNLGLYINTLQSLGHTWTQTQIDTFQSFLTSISENNWDVAYCFPFFGDTAECVKVPLLLNIGDEKYATVGDKDSYEVSTPDWSDFVVKDTNDIVIAAKSSSTEYLALPFTMSDLATYIGNDGYLTGSVTLIGEAASTGVPTRFFGTPNSDVGESGEDWLYTIRDTEGDGTMLCYLFKDLNVAYTSNDYYFHHKAELDKITVQVGDVASVTESNLTFSAVKYDATAATNLKMCIGGNPSVNGSGVFAGLVSLSPNSSVKFLSFEKNDVDEDGYRTAVGDLCAALGKIN